MILKFRTKKGWIFLDNVSKIQYHRISHNDIENRKIKTKDDTEFFITPWDYDFSLIKNSESHKKDETGHGSGIFISGMKHEKMFNCILRGVCFLCTDKGKTIEKINDGR